ncbi:GDP-L-fucose synthase, partial [Ophiophagus hannah]
MDPRNGGASLDLASPSSSASSVSVGEEEEVSIREAAECIAKAMDFKGQLLVSFVNDSPGIGADQNL